MRLVISIALLLITAPLCLADSPSLPSSNIPLMHALGPFDYVPHRVINQPPVAIITTLDGDPPPEYFVVGQPIQLSGHTSYDPEGDELYYIWSFGYNYPLFEEPIVSPTFAIEPPETGEMYVILRAYDSHGQPGTSEMLRIRILDSGRIRLEMTFGCEGMMDTDLYVVSPSGGRCSDSNMDSRNTCLFPLGNGTAIFYQYATNCEWGNRETMQIEGIADGPWTVGLLFREDCIEETILDPPLCMEHGDSDATINIFCDDATEPTFSVETTLTEEGQSKEWRMIRRDGVCESIQSVN